jgi:hypothetical protein
VHVAFVTRLRYCRGGSAKYPRIRHSEIQRQYPVSGYQEVGTTGCTHSLLANLSRQCTRCRFIRISAFEIMGFKFGHFRPRRCGLPRDDGLRVHPRPMPAHLFEHLQTLSLLTTLLFVKASPSAGALTDEEDGRLGDIGKMWKRRLQLSFNPVGERHSEGRVWRRWAERQRFCALGLAAVRLRRITAMLIHCCLTLTKAVQQKDESGSRLSRCV